MKNDVFEKCYQFNMERKFYMDKIYTELWNQYYYLLDKYGNIDRPNFDDDLAEKDRWIRVFWMNHPLDAFNIIHVYDVPDFMQCKKSIDDLFGKYYKTTKEHYYFYELMEI